VDELYAGLPVRLGQCLFASRAGSGPPPQESGLHAWNRAKNVAHLGGFGIINKETPSFGCHVVTQGRCPPIHLPFRPGCRACREFALQLISRSNWANDSRIFSVSRPSEDVVVELLCDRNEAYVSLIQIAP